MFKDETKTPIANSRSLDSVSAEHVFVASRPENVRGGDPFFVPCSTD